MSERIKRFIKLLALFLVICIPFYVTPVVRADSGWDSDYDSGSSWDSGSDWDSGSSWDSGSDWSSGSNWDSDYSGSSSTLGTTFEVLFTIVFLVIVSIAYFSKKTSVRPRTMTNPLINSYQDITQDHLSMVMPGANLYNLKHEAFNNFVAIQNAWMNFDYDKLRELCTDELYNSYVAQLETLKLKNGQNIMLNFDQKGTKIIDIDEVNGEIILTVFMTVEFFDYVINTTTKKVTRGNQYRKIVNNYVMTFVMSSNNDSDNTKCPNCGAPIEHITSGECEYCHSTIIKKASKFVLSKKTNVNK